MSDYLEKGKEVLSVLTNNGHQAYLIGEVVRSIMLDTGYDEIDITTSASIEQITKSFSQYKHEIFDEDKVLLYYEGYLFSVSPFKNIDGSNFAKKNKRIHYSEILEKDLASRDFTINAIAMSHGGMLTDAFNGYKDLTTGKIRAIGNPFKRFKDDPIQIIRAARLVSELNFKMDRKTANAFKRRAKYVSRRDNDFDFMSEIKKLIDGKYLKKALVYINDAKLYKYINYFGFPLKRLAKKYMECDFAVFSIAAFAYNSIIPDEFEDFFSDLDKIRELVELALLIAKKNNETILLYKYGLDKCLIANKANRLLGKSKKKDKHIIKLYKSLPIKSNEDLLFKQKDLINLTNGIVNQTIMDIYENIEYKVITKELANNYELLNDFAIEQLKSVKFSTMEELKPSNLVDEPQERVFSFEDSYSEKQTPIYSNDEENEVGLNNESISEYEKKLAEREYNLRKKEEEIRMLEKHTLKQKLDVEARDLANQSIEILKSMKYIEHDSVSTEVKKELMDTFEKVLVKSNPKYDSLKEGNRNEED
ncbi:MAG: hypothetical protein RBR27_00555 [Bacilli bacterium]|nr:hypothetical protein [Bacilli bacterium]